MKMKKLSLKLIVFFAAAAAISVLALVSGTRAYAQAGITVVTGSDAFAAALSDGQCTAIELQPDVIYELDTTVEVNRSLTIRGKGATVNFLTGANIAVTSSNKLMVSEVSLYAPDGHALSISGSLTIGERVMFSGRNGILMRSGSDLTSGGVAVTAAEGLSALVTVETGGGTVLIHDIRLTQTKGSTDMISIAPGSGKLSLRGTVEILAADGCAIFCPSESAGPDIAAEDNTVLSLSAPKAVANQADTIPGAAVNVQSCTFSTGTGTRLGVTGSYCGIAAKIITIGKDTTVTAQCDSRSDKDSLRCAALSAKEKLICLSGAKITVGSSGANWGSGIYGGQVDIDSLASVMYRTINDRSAAIASSGNVSISENASLVTNGGCGISCAQLTVYDKVTLDINDAAADGITATAGVKIGASCTVDISAANSAIRAKTDVIIGTATIAELSSAGDAPALWIEGQGGNLTLNGCTVNITCASSDKAQIKCAAHSGGGVTIEGGADVTIINDGDIGLVAAGGNISVAGGSVLRCSGGIGILSSRGSVLVSDGATLLAEGKLDSAVRVERGSFSLTGGAKADIQGARFGVETASGDFYIDGAGSFDIRSTADRAVYIGNGRMTVQNIERISAWQRHEEKKNTELWWKQPVQCKYSWEAPGSDKSNWLYAGHTALSPVISQQHALGIGQPSSFAWYDGEWLPADYSRLGQYASKPVGRANSYNIPAGKSFSWMLFGQTYDDKLIFRLGKSSGDGDFELLENGAFTYTAYDYTRGFQSFDFTVENGDGVVSDPVTVTVFVTASKPPIACSATIPIDTYDHCIDQVNVIDYDGNIASLKIAQQPEHGTLVLNSDGRFSYQAEEDFVGIDSFSYYAVDNMGDESNIARITLPVKMETEAVVCNTTIITESSTPNSVRLVALMGSETVDPAPVFSIVSHPTYGTLEFSESEPDIVTYHPYQDFSGTDSFTFIATMPDGTVTAEGFVSVATIPGQRPVANGGVFYCSKNSDCSERLSGYDLDGQITRFALMEQPQHGTVELDSLTGEFTYIPDGGYVGVDTFTYIVTDSDGVESDAAQVEINVTSLIENLRQTGRLGAAIVILCIAVVSIAAVVALIIIAVRKRRREDRMETAKSRLFEYGGSEKNKGYYDDYDYYD